MCWGRPVGTHRWSCRERAATSVSWFPEWLARWRATLSSLSDVPRQYNKGSPVNLGEFQPEYLIVAPADDVAVVRFTVPRLTEEINLEQVGHELCTLIEQHGCRKMVVS